MDLTLDNFKEKKPKELNENLGFTLELCAGIIDKQGISNVMFFWTSCWSYTNGPLGLSPLEIAREEVIEETGYSPPLE